MKRWVGLIAGLVVISVLVPAPAIAGPTIAHGGGRGTVGGVTPFSQFGFEIARRPDGSVQGSFNCLIAGAFAVSGFHADGSTRTDLGGDDQ